MAPALDSEVSLVERLRLGDETAFEQLVSRHHAAMVRLARTIVSTDAEAEDIAQEAWLAVVRGVEQFEGRSTVKTWLFRILVNRAKSRGIREARSRPFASVTTGDGTPLDPDQFPRLMPCSVWAPGPEHDVVNTEIRGRIGRALDELPGSQRAVVMLRDVWGFSPAETCETLNLTEANQRVLLHRGRSRMRTILKDYLLDQEELLVH